MATKNRKLGSKFRLHIGETAAPAHDGLFKKIVNENSFNVKRSADVQDDDTKEEGKVTSPGSESWEVEFDFNEVFNDDGLSLTDEAFNTPWAWQIRDESVTPNVVWIEGEFILSDLEYTAESQGVRSGTGSLKNSGKVEKHAAGRTLTTGS